MVRVSPGFMPASCSVKPGMKPVAADLDRLMPVAVPPGNASPSTRPT